MKRQITSPRRLQVLKIYVTWHGVDVANNMALHLYSKNA